MFDPYNSNETPRPSRTPVRVQLRLLLEKWGENPGGFIDSIIRAELCVGCQANCREEINGKRFFNNEGFTELNILFVFSVPRHIYWPSGR